MNFRTWIRSRFVELNAALEDLYWNQENRNSTAVGSELKSQLVSEGEGFLSKLSSADLAGAESERFELLGDVGYFMAACRRHDIHVTTSKPALPHATTIALQLGAPLGTAPRFLTAHMETHNPAHNGTYRTFTGLDVERVFLDYNTRSAFEYMRAADALSRIAPLGISHPVTSDLLAQAAAALRSALELNHELSAALDVDRFFFCVRPYYKPHPVGRTEYRGANAGDFAAFNEIDTLLGLCSMSEPSYAQVVLEKIPYLVPEDRQRLRRSLQQPCLLDAFMAKTDAHAEPWFRANVSAFLDVVDAHGEAAAHHHDDLVEKFIRLPAAAVPASHLEGITASGPPLDVLLRSLERLRDQRLAAPRTDIPTRHADISTLRQLVEGQQPQ